MRWLPNRRYAEISHCTTAIAEGLTRRWKRRRYAPLALGVRSAQGRRHRSGILRPAADTAFSGYVWQEPHLLYRRHGWLRLRPIGQGKIDTMPLITHRFPLSRIGEAYRLFESRQDGAFYCKRGYKFVPPFAVKINSIDFVSDGPRPRVAPPAYPSGKEISSFSQYYFADWSASSSEIPSASATPRP